MDLNRKSPFPIEDTEIEPILIAIEKYISLIMIEFKDHIQKYNQIYTGICTNTDEYMNMFQLIIEDYCNEIQLNQTTLFEMISKLNAINNELPRLEEFYYKVREMRYGLEKTYKAYAKTSNQ